MTYHLDPNREVIADHDQHCCEECGRTCDCGCFIGYVPLGEALPFSVDECLGCSDCIDTLRSKVVSERAERAAKEWREF